MSTTLLSIFSLFGRTTLATTFNGDALKSSRYKYRHFNGNSIVTGFPSRSSLVFPFARYFSSDGDWILGKHVSLTQDSSSPSLSGRNSVPTEGLV
ncbi:hypothetical protein F4823DRAFT_485381 [Ustulina deusta]|nr:hypothetical protein F4823DRAFT_485381 [Ustulina deusta]